MISGFINRGAIAGTTRSAKVSFAHSRLNYSAGIDSQLILVPVEPSVSTATSSSTHQRRFQPTDRSVQSCSNYAGNHANSRSSQPVHEMRANSVTDATGFARDCAKCLEPTLPFATASTACHAIPSWRRYSTLHSPLQPMSSVPSAGSVPLGSRHLRTGSRSFSPPRIKGRFR